MHTTKSTKAGERTQMTVEEANQYEANQGNEEALADEARERASSLQASAGLSQPTSNHTPRATRKGEIHVNIEQGGSYRGLFQVWNHKGNELTASEEAELRDLFASAPALLRSNGELLEAAKELLITTVKLHGAIRDMDGNFKAGDYRQKLFAAIRNAEAAAADLGESQSK